LRFFIIIISIFIWVKTAAAETEIRLGVIASLTGYAAQFGQAVVKGVELAAEELKGSGVEVSIFVEDDRSEMKETVSAYKKLKEANQINAFIGGSWWANAIVKTVERDGIPFLSCETKYDKSFVRAYNYFSLAGDLRNWIRIYEPLIKERGWKKGLMIRFPSGFADTLNDEMKEMFSREGREFLEPIVYSDIEMSGASTLAAKAVAMRPDVIFVDSQPQSFGVFARELAKLRYGGAVITHETAEEAVVGKSFNTEYFTRNMFYLKRDLYSESFQSAFEKRYNIKPFLNADLGYYAFRIIHEAVKLGGNSVERIKSGVILDGKNIRFDENNVASFTTELVVEVK
jgi:ABC-type branched-subunit amino acid transport system substrate-binding protein